MDPEKVIFTHETLKITGTDTDIQHYTSDELDVIKQMLETAKKYVLENEEKVPHKFMRYIRANKKQKEQKYILYYGEINNDLDCQIMPVAYHGGDTETQDYINIDDLKLLLREDAERNMQETINMDDVKLVSNKTELFIDNKYKLCSNNLAIFDKNNNIIKPSALPSSTDNIVLRSEKNFYAGMIYLLQDDAARNLRTEAGKSHRNLINYNKQSYWIITRGTNMCIAPLELVDPNKEHLLNNPSYATVIPDKIIDVFIKDDTALINGKDLFPKVTKHISHENDGFVEYDEISLPDNPSIEF